MGVDARLHTSPRFGSHIDVKYAMIPSMIPRRPAEGHSAGNAAGTARAPRHGTGNREEIAAVVKRGESGNGGRADVQQHFVERGDPAQDRAYPHLRQAVICRRRKIATRVAMMARGGAGAAKRTCWYGRP
jgi:uncharacterized 2Fe-2S/4Fe-4S cluster protein (DUF4445 family)